jgi:hypothetical protein
MYSNINLYGDKYMYYNENLYGDNYKSYLLITYCVWTYMVMV